MSASPVSPAEPPLGFTPALPDHGPRLLLAPPPAERLDAAAADPSPELLRLAAVADSLLNDPLSTDMGDPLGARGAASPTRADLRPRVAAVAGLLRDAAEAVAAADARVAGARAEAARVAGRAEDDVARLWRTVSADVATRRASTDAYVARALERARGDADALLADASERAELMLARAEDVVAAWLEEANAEVARLLESVPGDADVSVLPVADKVTVPSADAVRPRRRRVLAWLFRRS